MTMQFDIKSRFDARVLWSGEAASLSAAASLAVSVRADLSGANLSRADLSWANLSRANLSRADLSRADLSGANLSRADLSGADLSRANLSRADLSGADLSRADLSRADLSRANLSRADLSWANLSRADLSGADLDFACWPLFCGSFSAKIDVRIAAQLAYHFCRVECADAGVRKAQASLRTLANKFHRVGECGEIKAATKPKKPGKVIRRVRKGRARNEILPARQRL
jgi:hypothetical protein